MNVQQKKKSDSAATEIADCGSADTATFKSL